VTAKTGAKDWRQALRNAFDPDDAERFIRKVERIPQIDYQEAVADYILFLNEANA
jgi:hypothetical protein